jgi:hypothetical protein
MYRTEKGECREERFRELDAAIASEAEALRERQAAERQRLLGIGKKLCSIAGCEQVARSKGLCTRHWQYQHKYGSAARAPEPKEVRKCAAEECSERARIKGWCYIHYQRWRRHGDPEKRKGGGVKSEARCTVCGEPVYAKGLCSVHYQRAWARGGGGI